MAGPGRKASAGAEKTGFTRPGGVLRLRQFRLDRGPLSIRTLTQNSSRGVDRVLFPRSYAYDP